MNPTRSFSHLHPIIIMRRSVYTFIVIMVFMMLTPYSHANSGGLRIEDNHMVGGNLDEVNFRDVATFFEKNFKIAFEGPEDLFQFNSSLHLEKCEPEFALKRILSNVNYIFTFDHESRLSKVTLLHFKNRQPASIVSGPSSSASPSGRTVKAPSLKTSNSIKKLPKSSTKGSNLPGVSEEDIQLSVVKNAPPPGIENTEVEGGGIKTSLNSDELKIIPQALPPGMPPNN